MLDMDNLDIWLKAKYSVLKRKFGVSKWVLQKKFKNFNNFELDDKIVNFQETLYVSKARQMGASEQLPFAILVELGKLGSDPLYREDIDHIIKSNILMFKDHCYKLTDKETFPKVHKALRLKMFKVVADNYQDIA